MLRRTLHRRAGFSLVEVLVALFIVAAGLIALLTLFPLGAIQMGQALRDDRSQQLAWQADGKIRELWRARVVEGPGTDLFYTTMDDADGVPGVPTPAAPFATLPADRRVSYPVLFDPFGYASYPAPKRDVVAQLSGGWLPRRTANPIPPYIGAPPAALAYRYTTLQDDMEFGPDGRPADRDGLSVTTPGQNIFRNGRYNFAAVIRRPDNSNRFVADLKILVFDRRVPGVNPVAPNNELHYRQDVAVGSTQLNIPDTNDVLGLQVGDWLCDATMYDGTPAMANSVGIRNLNFFRVTSVFENGANTLVEVHVPIPRPQGEWVPAVPNVYTADLYLFRELIDVYDRPQLTPSGYLKQTP